MSETVTPHFLPGYGPLDVLMGQRADEDVFPVVIDGLEKRRVR